MKKRIRDGRGPFSGTVLQWDLSPSYGWCGFRKQCKVARTIYRLSYDIWYLRVVGTDTCLCCSPMDEMRRICPQEALRLLAEHGLPLPTSAATDTGNATPDSSSPAGGFTSSVRPLTDEGGGETDNMPWLWWETGPGYAEIEWWRKDLRWENRRRLLRKLTSNVVGEQNVPQNKGRILEKLIDLLSCRLEEQLRCDRALIMGAEGARWISDTGENVSQYIRNQISAEEVHDNCPVILNQVDDQWNATLSGKRKHLQPAQHKAVSLLVSAYPRSVPIGKVARGEKEHDYRSALKTLLRDEDWKRVLVSPLDGRNRNFDQDDRGWRLIPSGYPSPGIP